MQTSAIGHLRNVLDDETFGAPVPLPTVGTADHRVFQAQIAHPPKMWSTHPAGREREDNAKRRYIPATLDDRSAWMLFDGEPDLRRITTAQLLEHAIEGKKTTPVSVEESIATLDAYFSRPWFDRRYRGAYLGRSLVRDAADSSLLVPEVTPGHETKALDRLYPDSLSDDIKRWRALEEEAATLDAIQEGTLTASDGVIRHRGKVIAKRELPAAIVEVKNDITAIRARLAEHDRQCRAAHLTIARALGQNWDRYLGSLLSLLHYAEHTEANLLDAQQHLDNVLHVVLADGEISSAEAKRLVIAATEVHVALWELFEQRTNVALPSAVATAMKVTSWGAALPVKLNLNAPEADNLVNWLNEIGTWLKQTVVPLGDLKRETLAQLLLTEEAIARAARCRNTRRSLRERYLHLPFRPYCRNTRRSLRERYLHLPFVGVLLKIK
jgi:hypothetical protein